MGRVGIDSLKTTYEKAPRSEQDTTIVFRLDALYFVISILKDMNH